MSVNILFFAEGEGFEPSDPVTDQRFSRPPQSSTLPTLHKTENILRRIRTEIFLTSNQDALFHLCYISSLETCRDCCMFSYLSEWWDSNPHAFRHQILSLARLPVTTHSEVLRVNVNLRFPDKCFRNRST